MINATVPFACFAAILTSATAANAACYSERKYFKTVNTSDWYEITNNCGGDISVHYATHNNS
jgi:hypothetical protein